MHLQGPPQAAAGSPVQQTPLLPEQRPHATSAVPAPSSVQEQQNMQRPSLPASARGSPEEADCQQQIDNLTASLQQLQGQQPPIERHDQPVPLGEQREPATSVRMPAQSQLLQAAAPASQPGESQLEQHLRPTSGGLVRPIHCHIILWHALAHRTLVRTCS